MTKELLTNEVITVDSLKNRLKQTFVGQPPQPSERRQFMQDLARLYPSVEGIRQLEKPTITQVALVLPEEIIAQTEATQDVINKSGATAEDVEEAKDLAFKALEWSKQPENRGRAYNFGPLRKPLESLVAAFAALLLVLTLSLTACAADTSAEPIKPSAALATSEDPIEDGVEGGEPTPAEIAAQQVAIFDTPRNLRTGPSATAAKTTLDGAGTTLAGQEYEFFEKITNSDNSVWIRLSKDGQQPEIWAVLIHPGLALTGTTEETKAATDEAWTSVEPGVKITDTLSNTAILTETQLAGLVSDYNKICARTGISEAVSVVQNNDGSFLYIGLNGKPVALAVPTIDPTTGELTAQLLFETDQTGVKTSSTPIAVRSGASDWQPNQTPSSSSAGSETAATGAVGSPSEETEPVAGQVEQVLALTPEEYMRSVLPPDFESYFTAQGKKVTFDEKINLFIAVDSKTKETSAIFPHASAGDPEKDLQMAESSFDPEKSCLSDETTSSFNPKGVKRDVCMFTGVEHPVYGAINFHPDVLKNQAEALQLIAQYVYKGNEEKINGTPFTLLINTSAADASGYTPRAFEAMNPNDDAKTLYEEWGMLGLGLPVDPRLRIDVITGKNGEGDTVIINAFPEYADILALVPPERLPGLPYTLPAKTFWLGVKLLHDRQDGKTTMNDADLDTLSTLMRALRTNKDAIIGGLAKDDYVANLEAY